MGFKCNFISCSWLELNILLRRIIQSCEVLIPSATAPGLF